MELERESPHSKEDKSPIQIESWGYLRFLSEGKHLVKVIQEEEAELSLEAEVEESRG